MPALVTAWEGTEAKETGSVVIAAAPSERRTKAGVPTGASTVIELPESFIPTSSQVPDWVTATVPVTVVEVRETGRV